MDGTDGLAVHASGLVKRYGGKAALDGFDLSVPAGSVCGLLGPNGAGKTTAVRVLTTLLRADEGTAVVAGHDVRAEADLVRSRIGLSGQEPAVDEILSGRQNVELFARLAGLRKPEARRRADELLELMGLGDTGGKSVKHFSGGMRRRLDLAVTLILAPAVLFLDEPTTGLDPRNRNDVWSAIRDLVAGGTTVLLTTQYLDEADQLADSIVLIESGTSIATGTPAELKQRAGGDQLELVVGRADDLSVATEALAAVSAQPPQVDPDTRTISAPVVDRVTALTTVVSRLGEQGVTIDDIGLRRPTLDDVFLALTGRPAEPEPDPSSDEKTEVAA